MSSVPQNHDAARYHTSPDEPVVYPEQQVLAVFDDAEALAAAISEVTQLGVLDSEIDVACGTERADALRESTGRSGLAHLAIRIADQLGIRNTEMEAKARYEQAMRDGEYVLRVPAPSDDFKSRVVDVLKRHGAHGISYFSKFTIERIVPHRQS
jgi:hypothetical protein